MFGDVLGGVGGYFGRFLGGASKRNLYQSTSVCVNLVML